MAKVLRLELKAGDILIHDSSKTVSHCGLVIKNFDVAHATSNGMLCNDAGEWLKHSDVWRPKNLLDGMEDRLDKIGRLITKDGTKTEHGTTRAGISWFGSSSFGDKARGRLATYRLRMELAESKTKDQVIMKNVFCSELVIVCYQLACKDENSRHFIKLDGKHTMPKNLRAYLDEDKTYWEKAGEYGTT